MADEIKVTVQGMQTFRQALGAIFSKDRFVALNREIGFAIREKLADHISRASVSRHTVANRLGAKYTKFLEFAGGRVANPGPGRSVGKYKGNPKPFIESQDADYSGVSVVICNTPGLSRAFHDLHITPVNRQWLTIPMHADAYGRSVAEFRALGRTLFRPRKANGVLCRILAENVRVTSGRGKKKRTRTEMRTMYALVKSVRVPQDRGLLPRDEEIAEWASDTAKTFLGIETDDF